MLVPHLALIFITSLKPVDSPSFDSISLAKTNVAGVSDLVASLGDYLENTLVALHQSLITRGDDRHSNFVPPTSSQDPVL